MGNKKIDAEKPIVDAVNRTKGGLTVAEVNGKVLSCEDFFRPISPEVSFSGLITSLHHTLFNLVTNTDKSFNDAYILAFDTDANLASIAIPFSSLRRNSLHFIVLSAVMKQLKERGVLMKVELREMNGKSENYLVLSPING